MVIEYVGQLIRTSLCDKRETYYNSKNIGCYMFKIDDVVAVDATLTGGPARLDNIFNKMKHRFPIYVMLPSLAYVLFFKSLYISSLYVKQILNAQMGGGQQYTSLSQGPNC